jgi:uncharacterized OB-fold protein
MSRVLPVIGDGNRPFWDGCREGELRLQRCEECGRLRYPVSEYCPNCMSARAAWEAVSGRGEVYSFVVFRHAYNDAWRDRVPYVVALVQLEEGPIVIGNVTGTEPEGVSVGMPVAVTFERVTDEVTVPAWELR